MKDSDPSANNSLVEKYKIEIRSANVDKSDAIVTKLYTKRWLMLGLYSLFCFANTSQWVQYTIVENIVARYYNVSLIAVEWTGLMFSCCAIVFTVPASYIMNKVGLRNSCVIGMVGTTLGAWLKVFANAPDRIPLVFIGQFVVAVCQIPVATMPTRVSAYWFNEREVGTATVLGCFGPPLGIALFLLIAPMVIKNHANLDDIGHDLHIFALAVAIFCSVICVAVLALFQDEPKFPPTIARALNKINQNETENSRGSIKRLFKSKNFLLLWNSYGIIVGVLNTITNLLNPLYLAHFENGEEDAGRIGLSYFVIGTFCCIFCGLIMDRTNAYKVTFVIINLFTVVGFISFGVTLHLEVKWAIYLTATIMGTFLMLCFASGYEVCAEMTYPEPEETAAALLCVASHIYTIIFTPIMNKLLENYGDVVANIVIGVFLVIGLITSVMIKDERKRQTAGKNKYTPPPLP